MLVLFQVEEISDIPYSSRSWSFCRTWNDKYSGEKNSKRNVYHSKIECAKFRGSRAIVGLMGLVPSCQRALVGLKLSRGVSWVWNFFSWVPKFFSWVFGGSDFFSREYFAYFFSCTWFCDSNTLHFKWLPARVRKTEIQKFIS